VNTRDLAQLFKFPISIMSTVSAATGYLAFSHGLTWGLLPTCGGILLLAFCACALNEAQEHKLDGLMERTRGRPIPAGKISPTRTVLLALWLGVLALLLLYLTGGPIALALGALAVLWYNVIYTYLKRVSSIASVVGSVIGAIPPAVGWVCAGGSLDGPILSLSFFLLMWQVPHFWLLALRISGDYEQAQFPTFVRVMGANSLSRVTFVWTTATAASALLLPIFGLSSSPFLGLGLVAAGAWLVLVAWRSLRAPSKQGVRQAFHAINYYAVMVMGAVILDAMLGR
jgi:protoheme IX farnesyltransferase